MILPLDRIGKKLLTHTGISEVADQQRLQGFRLAHGDVQMPVVDLRLELRGAGLADVREQHAIAPLVAQPTGHHTLARGRISEGEEEIGARILRDWLEPGRAHGHQLRGRLAQIQGEARGNDLPDIKLFISGIREGLAGHEKG